MNQKAWEQARPILERHLDQQPEAHEARLLYGQCLIKLEQYDEAVKALKPLKKSMAENSGFHFWLGQAYLGKLNNSSNFFEKGIVASKAKEAFEKAVELDPENLTARNSLAQYYLNAPGIAGGSLKKAKEQIDFIKSRNPGMGYALMANYYFGKKEYDTARKEYEEYLKVAEDKSRILYQIGFTYQLEKNFDRAFHYFRQSIKQADLFMPSYYQYARTAVFAEKNIKTGIGMMKTYINKGGSEGGPDLASAYWRLGMLHALNRDKAAAKKAYERALELNPEHEQADRALEEMKQ